MYSFLLEEVHHFHRLGRFRPMQWDTRRHSWHRVVRSEVYFYPPFATEVWDVDEEPLLRHFCLEEECSEVPNRKDSSCGKMSHYSQCEVLKWFKEANYERPEDQEIDLCSFLHCILTYMTLKDFNQRLDLAKRL